jgi:hypothetical protein
VNEYSHTQRLSAVQKRFSYFNKREARKRVPSTGVDHKRSTSRLQRPSRSSKKLCLFEQTKID